MYLSRVGLFCSRDGSSRHAVVYLRRATSSEMQTVRTNGESARLDLRTYVQRETVARSSHSIDCRRRPLRASGESAEESRVRSIDHQRLRARAQLRAAARFFDLRSDEITR
jgi:hypothetical protein